MLESARLGGHDQSLADAAAALEGSGQELGQAKMHAFRAAICRDMSAGLLRKTLFASCPAEELVSWYRCILVYEYHHIGCIPVYNSHQKNYLGSKTRHGTVDRRSRQDSGQDMNGQRTGQSREHDRTGQDKRHDRTEDMTGYRTEDWTGQRT